ncbi:MAG TPA: hypothetical protein P5057_05185 [Acidobacteriota bacterium]|nr:hypothetical protein [Acidobacteriota bacterium]
MPADYGLRIREGLSPVGESAGVVKAQRDLVQPLPCGWIAGIAPVRYRAGVFVFRI